MTERLHGLCVGVHAERLGATITFAPPLATTTLTVDDASDFNPAGGWLRITGDVIDYDSADLEANTIHLPAALGGFSVDARVEVWDGANGSPAVRYKATVDSIDGFDGRPVDVLVSQSIAHVLSTTMRTGGIGESVTLERDGSQLTIVAVDGRNFALAALQYVQEGLTTRQEETDSGVDLLGSDTGTPGLFGFKPGGDASFVLDALTGNVSIIGEFGTALPGDEGIFAYSLVFRHFGDRTVTRPVLQFQVHASRDQPSIQADDVGSPNLYLYSGASTAGKETQVFVGQGQFLVGIEHTANDGVYTGAQLDVENGLCYLLTDGGIGPNSTNKGYSLLADGSTLHGYVGTTGNQRGFAYQGTTATDWARIYTNNRMDVVSPDASSFMGMNLAELHSTSGGLFMDDLNGGGLTGASIGNSGRVQRTTSSARYKHSIRDLKLDDALAVVRGFRSRTFKRRKTADDRRADPRRYAGAIAEELAEIPAAAPFVFTDAAGRPEGIHYAELAAAAGLPVLADHDRQFDELRGQVADLEARLAALERDT
jgi:hypothetical protein